MFRIRNLWICATASLLVSACLGESSSDEPKLAPSWEEFRANPPVSWETVLATTPREPFAPHRFIVEGDIALADEQALREHYEAYLAQEYAARVPSASPLTVYYLQADVIWPVGQRDLTYCISNDFGVRKPQLVFAMNRATSSWSSQVAVRFIYQPDEDASCNSSNDNVVFNVSPVDTSIYPIALPFRPDASRPERQLLIAEGAFTYTAGGYDLDAFLRHTTGHILGFRHEYIWNRWNTCVTGSLATERLVTAYDVNSVMHVYNCRPTEASGLRQTELDYAGAIALYGSSETWNPQLRTLDFNDAGGWAASQSYWGTLAYPDVDGDGKHDVCARGSFGVACGLSIGTAFSPSWVWTSAYSNYAAWGSAASYWDTIEYPDLNGDKRQDICGRSAFGLRCALSTGIGFAPDSLWSTSYSDSARWNAEPSYWKTIKYMDLNGDERQDVCGRSAFGLYCALSTGTSFGTPRYWSLEYAETWAADPAHWDTIEYPDLNGDHMHDVCGRSAWGPYCALSTGTSFGTPTYWSGAYGNPDGWGAYASHWATIQYPDLNGDDRQDICGRGAFGMYCALSTGTGFGVPTYWTRTFGNDAGWDGAAAYWDTIEFPDINGDNMHDVCGRSSFGIVCGLSTGTSFTEPSYRTSAYSDAAGWGAQPYWDTIAYPDVNGDHKQDICGRAPGGILCGL